MKEIRVELDNGNYYLMNEAKAFHSSEYFITDKYVNGVLVDTFAGNNLSGCFSEIALDIKTDETLERGSFN